MNTNPQLDSYSQDDITKMYNTGSIAPVVDEFGNLKIENIAGELFYSTITIPMIGVVFNSVKVETKNDPAFYEL